MQFTEAIKLALQSLWANKMRTILTLIGVVMGVASVIMVITLVNGANKYVSTKLSGYGADVFTVTRMAPRDLLRRRLLPLSEAQDHPHRGLRGGARQLHGVQRSGRAAQQVNQRGLQRPLQQQHRGARLHLDHAQPEQHRYCPGPRIYARRRGHGTHDAIVGYDIVDNLLGDGDPIGKEIRVDGIPYTIVGVGDRQGKTLGQSQDNWVAVPITTYQQTYGYNDSVDIYARANGNAEVMERAKDEVRVLMRTRRHNAPGTDDDFEIATNDTFLDIWKQISSLFAWVVLGIASISLVVGGIVIMNIMLVSVTERTREIGVRKALGAKQRDVLLQFLIESATMALTGGAIGVLMRGHCRQADHADHWISHHRAVVERSAGAVCGRRHWHLLRRLPRQQGRQAGPGGGVAGGAVKAGVRDQGLGVRRNGMVQSFRDLQVWQRAIQMSIAIYRLTQGFPREELYGLTSQIRRAAVSVASNIAEGHGRLGSGEYRQFLGFARGSNFEVQTQLEIARALGLGDSTLLGEAEGLSLEVGKMISGILNAIKDKDRVSQP